LSHKRRILIHDYLHCGIFVASVQFPGVNPLIHSELKLIPNQIFIWTMHETNVSELNFMRRMVSSGLLRRLALIRTDVSEEPGASFIRVTFLRSVRRLLVSACVVPSSPIVVTLMKEGPGSSETSVLTRATRRNNPEDTILHSRRRENLKSELYVFLLSP
jgi:hypothetical protein